MFIPDADCDPTQVIGDAELDQLVKDKIGTWQAGVWDGKKGCPKLTIEGLFASPSKIERASGHSGQAGTVQHSVP
jgi:hypothetical protein